MYVYKILHNIIKLYTQTRFNRHMRMYESSCGQIVIDRPLSVNGF